MNDITGLMLHFLQDIYYAEKLGLRSMATLIRAVENEELKAALQQHREQSQKHVERLAEVFAAFGKKPRAKTCAAMDGLAEECSKAIEQSQKGPVLDAALIACQQAVEHYEIARYGALAAWARAADMDDAAEILQEILQEEDEANERLNDIAELVLNPEAADEDSEAEEEEEEEDEAPEEDPEPIEDEPKPVRGRRAPARAKH